jgi:hypothetical protein
MEEGREEVSSFLEKPCAFCLSHLPPSPVPPPIRQDSFLMSKSNCIQVTLSTLIIQAKSNQKKGMRNTWEGVETEDLLKYLCSLLYLPFQTSCWLLHSELHQGPFFPPTHQQSGKGPLLPEIPFLWLPNDRKIVAAETLKQWQRGQALGWDVCHLICGTEGCWLAYMCTKP